MSEVIYAHMMDAACRYVRGMQCSVHRMHACAPRMNMNIRSGRGFLFLLLICRLIWAPSTLLQRNMYRRRCSQRGGCGKSMTLYLNYRHELNRQAKASQSDI